MGIFKKINDWQDRRRKEQEYKSSPEYLDKVLNTLDGQAKIEAKKVQIAKFRAVQRKMNTQNPQQQNGFGAGLANLGANMFSMSPQQVPQRPQMPQQHHAPKKKKKKRMMVVYGYPEFG